ncbi:mitochondrial inner membrane protease subunit 2-like isoform X2 [Clavelina lepadiformis]|uniref:mitochondrial inner membrane protease subunit 2-like isoform X2 n=1 Tax=Clavelina lepadiformis TaxID=159417 RepID=UPI004041D413
MMLCRQCTRRLIFGHSRKIENFKPNLIISRSFRSSLYTEEIFNWKTSCDVAFYSVFFFCGFYYVDNKFLSVTAVSGRSMQPTINPDDLPQKDWVFLDRRPQWNHKSVQRGDIVTFKTTRDPNSIYVKRVVGLEGDIVTTLGYRKRSVLVPAGHCWLEGDNHLASDDSNKFGPIPMGLITARATHVIYPVTRWQHLPRKFPHSRVKINPGCNDDQVWDLEQV